MHDDLTAEEIAADGTPLRTVRYRMARWEREGWPAVRRVPRVDATGNPIGGVMRVVDRAQYEAMCRGELPPSARRVELEAHLGLIPVAA